MVLISGRWQSVGAPGLGKEPVGHLLDTLRLCGGEVVLFVGVGGEIVEFPLHFWPNSVTHQRAFSHKFPVAIALNCSTSGLKVAGSRTAA